MRIDIVGRNIEITDAMREHAEEKCAKLTKYFDLIQLVTVRVEADTHHSKGEFAIEMTVDVEHHEDFVAKATDRDVYAAMDQAFHKSVRQLTDYKEKLKLGKR